MATFWILNPPKAVFKSHLKLFLNFQYGTATIAILIPFLNSIAQHTAIILFPPPPPLSPPPPNKLFIYFFHSGKKRGHYVKACFEAEAHMLYIVVSQNQTFNEHHKHKISWT